MTNTANNKPCYIPLNLTSQSKHEHVLYYNANAPLDDIYDIAITRLRAAIDLVENINDYKDAPASSLQAFATAISLLLNDSCTLLEEFNPVAANIRNDKM